MLRTWNRLCPSLLAMSLLAACSDSDNPPEPPPPPPPPEPLSLSRVVGGQLTDLVLSGQLAYVATGRVVAVWDFSDPSAPVQVGAVDEPASALISGLALHGTHLYASWQAGNDQGGVTIYSLADPAQPAHVNDIAIDAAFSHVNAVAVANDHLYLFDTENGIWVGSLVDPEAPTLTTDGTGLGGVADRTHVDGNLIYAFGKSFIGNAVLTTWDVSTPESPTELQTFVADDIDSLTCSSTCPWPWGSARS